MLFLRKVSFCLLLTSLTSLTFFSCSEWISDDIDWQPVNANEYPIVMFAVKKTDESFQEMKSWGVNYVQTYTGGKDTTEDLELFNLAAQYQMKVLVNLDRSLITAEGGLSTMESYANYFKDHPALGAWYLYDEPDNASITPAQLTPFYNMLKTVTPDVPVAIAHGWTTNWYRYDGVQDILMNDLYPVEGRPFPTERLDNMTRFTETVRTRPNDFFPILQFFNWSDFAPAGATQYRGFPVDQLRYPTQHEFRYSLFSSLTQGAKGIALYSHARSGHPQNAWVNDSAVSVIRELRFFTRKIDGYQFNRLVAGTANPFLLSEWIQNNSRYMVLANQTSSTIAVDTTINFAGQLVPFGKTRSTTALIDSGRLIVEGIHPWEILVWKVDD